MAKSTRNAGAVFICLLLLTVPQIVLACDWDVEIEKCSSGWIPTKDGTTNITARITPPGVTGTIKFTLQSVSDEPGYCLNAGTETTTDKDLKFQAQCGFTISGSQDSVATTTSAVNSATVTVTCYDYGAYGQIKAEATVGETTKTAHVVGGEAEFVRIPRDDDTNHIADAWTYNTGNATDDAETNPSGDGTNGDGLSRYEEYRGFLQNGEYGRTDPTKKDYFVDDSSAFGELGSFPGNGMPESHRLTGSEVDEAGPTFGRVNFKGETAHNQNVFACMMVDMGLPPTYYGQCTGPVWQSSSYARIDTAKISDAWDDPFTNPHGHTYDELEDWVIGHELGHSVLWHQGGDDHGHHSGATTQDCVIWEFAEFEREEYPTEFCSNNPGCQTMWKVKN